MSLHEEELTPVHDDEADWYEPEDEDLPARPRRRLVTPVTLGLSAVIIGAGGFIAGVQVQKGQDDGASGASGAIGARAAARFPGAGAPGGGAQGASGPTAIGQVANKRGSTLYVTDSSGATVRVKTSSQSKITRNANASSKGIYPGDTVIIQGTRAKDGTVTATQITATAKNASVGGLGAFAGGGPPGGGAGGGGAQSGAPAPSGG